MTLVTERCKKQERMHGTCKRNVLFRGDGGAPLPKSLPLPGNEGRDDTLKRNGGDVCVA